MCGVAGIYSPSKPVDGNELDLLTDSLAHRGPDGRGTYIDQNLGLGHRRLAILDLSERGRCPMEYLAPDGRKFVITYNGEVYNFLEIRRSLEKLGHSFVSDTDTEVVVAAYSQWGIKALNIFNGMWAFAIWDPQSRELFISRDRFGIKPLYYYASSRFVFASEIKAFLSLSSFTPAVDEQAAMEALRSPGAYEGRTEATLLKGVRRLPPGCYMKVNSSGQCIGGRWWDTSANLPPLASSYQRQVSDFRDLFLDAVQVRLRSDVPVGTCLSGGIDSSAVASIIAYLQNNRGHLERSQKDWQNTFIATFPNTEIDERRFADVVVRHIGATPHYWEFQPEQAHEYLLPTVWSMEEVYNGIAIPTWCLYRSLREKNVVVTLDGHGADELLAGYPWTLDWTMPEMNEKLSADFHFNILPAILRNFDRCSMAHGIEIRMPFLDWRVVTYCFALEASAKIGAGYTKRILRDAMKDIMPEEIRTRRQKIGFNTPMITWFNGEMSPLIEKIVGHRAWIESPFFHGPTEAAKILEKTRSKAWKLSDWNFALQSWTKMNLVLWQMLFVDREMSPNQLGSELH